jgi:hypothetical protein
VGDIRESLRVRPAIRRMLRIVLPVLAIVAAWQIWDNVETRRLEAELAPIAAAGTVGVRNDPPRAGGDEAARYYAAAAVAVEAVETPDAPGDIVVVEREALARGVAPPEAVAAAAASIVAANEWPLRLLDHGSRLPFHGFDPSRSSSQRTAGLILLGRAAAHRTLDLIQRDATDAAADSLVARIQLLRAFETDQWGYRAMERARELRGIATDVATLLGRVAVPVSRSEEIERALASVSGDDGLARVFAAMALNRHDFARSAGAGRSWQYGAGGVLLRPVLTHHVRGLIGTTTEALGAATLPWPKRVNAIGRLTDSRSWIPMPPPIPAAAWQVADQFRALTVTMGEAVAAVRAAQLALKIDSYRQARGVIAVRLDDVSMPRDGSSVEDPFTGEPLRYVAQDVGFVLYSVGRDGRDDGGSLAPEQVKGHPPGTGVPKDVGVRVSYRRAALMNPSNSALNSPVR